jgi:VWFA-related protein
MGSGSRLARRPFCRAVALAIFSILVVALAFPGAARAQAPSSTESKDKPASNPAEITTSDANSELTTRDKQTGFKVHVNLVLVRVVVRDSSGKPVGDLRKEDFQLFDDRKPQAITHFSVETPNSRLTKAVPPVESEAPPEEKVESNEAGPPQRFIAFLFDDAHLELADIMRSRQAAERFLETSFRPTDRAAVFTTSGQLNLDFTSDQTKLIEALRAILPRPVTAEVNPECPYLTYYEADLMENHFDERVLAAVAQETLACQFQNDPQFRDAAIQVAHAAAQRALTNGQTQTEYSVRRLREIVRRLTALPGERLILYVSPGFWFPENRQDVSDIIDRATRSNVVVNTIDARGVFTFDPNGDISRTAASGRALARIVLHRMAGENKLNEVLGQLAEGTGGTFFHNSNDLDEGFTRIGAVPEVFYVLGFSPQNLKLDGRFHTLKVGLTSKQKYEIHARRGYYAPKHAADPAETARLEIEEAVFSQEEVRDLPVELHTQYFKTNSIDARLAVLTHIDLGRLRFRVVDGRHHNNLIVVAAIFDENGNILSANEKVIEMRLRDATLERLGRSGITVKSSFTVKPGSYLVRLVVRDAEGELMAAQNGSVVIPY